MKNFKKIIAVLCAGVLAFGLTACSSSQPSNSGDSTTAAGADAATQATGNGDATYNIGVLQLVQHEALDAATQGFQDALVEKLGDKVTFDVQNAAGDSATCVTIANGFVSDEVDLIMANATPSLQAASAATADIPIVGTAVTDYATALGMDPATFTGATGINVAGVADLAPADQTSELINELFPDIERIAILYCSAEANSKYQADLMRSYLEPMGYTVTDYTFADSNDVSQVTQTATDENELIYIPTDNTAASCTEAINNVITPANIPVVAAEEGIARGCGVATLSISYYDIGVKTGNVAYEILVNGADPATTQIEYADNLTKLYVKDRCEALGITVPDDYTELAVD